MPYLYQLPPVDGLTPSTKVMVVKEDGEFLTSLTELATEFKKTEYGFTSEAADVAPVGRQVLSSTNATLTLGSRVYTPFYIELTGNVTLTLPTLSADEVDADYLITVDVKQNSAGGKIITFAGVSQWYYSNPFDSSNPTELRYSTVANSYGLFTFRSTRGFWFASYGKAV